MQFSFVFASKKNMFKFLITKSEEKNIVRFVKLPPKMLNSSLADS